MTYTKNFYLLVVLLILLNGCGGGMEDFKKAVTGQKDMSTDEFLIKKKDPLILPPEFENLPTPRSEQSVEKTDSLKNILENQNNIEKNAKSISDLENQVLRELRRNQS